MRTIGLILLIALVGCGGGGSAESAGASFAVVHFPIDGGLTDAAGVVVRGTTREAATVRVNGLAARNFDGPLNWSVFVPLDRGTNRLDVEATDSDGTIHRTSIVVERQELLVGAVDIALDAANNRLLVIQDLSVAALGVLGIDLFTGMTSIVSGEGVGSGAAWLSPRAVAVDIAGNRAIVFDGNASELVAVDLGNGDRTLVSGSARGTGDEFTSIRALGLDASRNRAVAIDGSRLITIDLSSGNRAHFTDDFDRPRSLAIDAAGDRAIVLDGTSIFACALTTSAITALSDDTTGNGPTLTDAVRIAFDAARNVALVTTARDKLFEVNLTTGDRALLSDATTGSGTPIPGPQQIVVDAPRGRALINDRNDGYDAIIAVDLATGARSELFATSRGTGPFFDDPRDVTLDATRNRLLVPDPGSDGDQILAIDIRTGNRTVIAPYPSGNPESIVVDTTRDRILLADNSDDALYAMDPVTGARTTLSDAANGSGPGLESPQDLVLDAANDRALIADAGLDAIVAVDLDTGNRTIVSDASTGTGPNIESPQDIELDTANNRVLVIDSELEALVAIDLATGNRTIVSDESTGSGPAVEGREGFVLDFARNRALIVERGTVFTVDLTSGDRAILTDAETGSGPQLGYTLEDIVILAGDVAVIMDDSTTNCLFAIDLITGERCVFSK